MFKPLFTVMVLTVLAGCEPPIPSAEQIEREVSAQASATGSVLVAALRSCRLVGVEAVDSCAQIRGKLTQEIIAQSLAEAAVNQRGDFWKNCLAHYPQVYCQSLLERAVEISWNTLRP